MSEHPDLNAKDAYDIAVALVDRNSRGMWEVFRAMLLANTLLFTVAVAVSRWLANETCLRIVVGVGGIVLCVAWWLIAYRNHTYARLYVACAREWEAEALGERASILRRGHTLSQGNEVTVGADESMRLWGGKWTSVKNLERWIISVFIVLYAVLLIPSTSWGGSSLVAPGAQGGSLAFDTWVAMLPEPITLFTFVLAVVAVLQYLSMRAQSKWIRQRERPYVFGGPGDHGEPLPAREQPERMPYRIAVANTGRTTAIVKRIEWGLRSEKDLPSDPVYQHSMFTELVVQAGASNQTKARMVYRFDWQGEDVHVLYGRITYEDQFGNTYKSGFLSRIEVHDQSFEHFAIDGYQKYYERN